MHQITRNKPESLEQAQYDKDNAIFEHTPATTIHLVIDIKLADIPTDEAIDNAMTAIYPTLKGIGAIVTQVIRRTE